MALHLREAQFDPPLLEGLGKLLQLLQVIGFILRRGANVFGDLQVGHIQMPVHCGSRQACATHPLWGVRNIYLEGVKIGLRWLSSRQNPRCPFRSCINI